MFSRDTSVPVSRILLSSRRPEQLGLLLLLLARSSSQCRTLCRMESVGPVGLEVLLLKAQLHGGPCDAKVEDLAEPAPDIDVCAKPEEGWSPPPGPVPPNRETPRVPLVEHGYRLVRTDDGTAHYYEHVAG